MFGLTILILIAIAIICVLWLLRSLRMDWDAGVLGSALIGGFSTIAVLIMILMVPEERLESKRQIEYVHQLQVTLDTNRANYSEYERALIMKEINGVNALVAKWKVKGDHWYQNKWLYVPETKDVDYIH